MNHAVVSGCFRPISTAPLWCRTANYSQIYSYLRRLEGIVFVGTAFALY